MSVPVTCDSQRACLGALAVFERLLWRRLAGVGVLHQRAPAGELRPGQQQRRVSPCVRLLAPQALMIVVGIVDRLASNRAHTPMLPIASARHQGSIRLNLTTRTTVGTNYVAFRLVGPRSSQLSHRAGYTYVAWCVLSRTSCPITTYTQDPKVPLKVVPQALQRKCGDRIRSGVVDTWWVGAIWCVCDAGVRGEGSAVSRSDGAVCC